MYNIVINGPECFTKRLQKFYFIADSAGCINNSTPGLFYFFIQPSGPAEYAVKGPFVFRFKFSAFYKSIYQPVLYRTFIQVFNNMDNFKTGHYITLTLFFERPSYLQRHLLQPGNSNQVIAAKAAQDFFSQYVSIQNE